METVVLKQIQQANDIKKVNEEDYPRLAKEIRSLILRSVSKNGGHLSSNLGVVELTLALHLFMDFPEDRLVWDVGHQSYAHKILTGRKEELMTLRTFGGISGFPKRQESDCDAFDTGHASTAISVALGLAQARQLTGQQHKVVAVLGDGALTGGMAYEALNNASKLKGNLLIVLNDNNMSISENVGGMAQYLGGIRTDSKYRNLKDGVEDLLHKIPGVGDSIISHIRKSKDSIKRLLIPGMLFEDMGLTYIGPIDGHDIKAMQTAFEHASKLNEAVIVHVLTQKGKGYQLAERNPSYFHGIGPFDLKTGKIKETHKKKSYTGVVKETLVSMAGEDEKLAVVCAAMPQGTGVDEFARKFPKRCFDVGIAEEHAVTFAAGLAAGGMHPFVAIYSTFLQRAYDQILHDVCLPKLPVTFLVDRAGIVGQDGETHQGCFDLSYLGNIPNMTVMTPKDGKELGQMLQFAVKFDGPCAIRYPKGAVPEGLWEQRDTPVLYGKSECLSEGQEIALIAVGSMVEAAWRIKEGLKEKVSVTVVNARFVKPFDREAYEALAKKHRLLVTLEENVRAGGFGQQVVSYLEECLEECCPDKVRMLNIAIEDQFISHGDRKTLLEDIGMDVSGIRKRILDEWEKLK